MEKPYVKFFTEATDLKYFLDPNDEPIQLSKYETHVEYLANHFDEGDDETQFDRAIQDGWIRILGANGVLYFHCYDYTNKTFKRIYNLLQKNETLRNYSSDIEVNDSKTKKRYRYYGSKLQPVRSSIKEADENSILETDSGGRTNMFDILLKDKSNNVLSKLTYSVNPNIIYTQDKNPEEYIYIEWADTPENFRNKGYASQLFDYLIKKYPEKKINGDANEMSKNIATKYGVILI